jgi:hypothetical protein
LRLGKTQEISLRVLVIASPRFLVSHINPHPIVGYLGSKGTRGINYKLEIFGMRLRCIVVCSGSGLLEFEDGRLCILVQACHEASV